MLDSGQFNELQHKLYQYEDVLNSIPNYLDIFAPIEQRFVLIASSIQLTNNYDEPWMAKTINLMLSNEELLQ